MTTAQRKIGRNDPCWCGSQRKYKKCHLAADREASKPLAVTRRNRRARRVVLERPATANPLDTLPSRKHQAERGWAAQWASGRQVDTHPVCRLTESGPNYGVAPNAGDLVAYFADPARFDDCLRPALATVAQVPVEELHDPDLDGQLRQGVDPGELDGLGELRDMGYGAGL